MNEETIPALRGVELVPVTHQGQSLFLMRDPTGVAEESVLLSPASAGLLRFFDGRHGVRDLQAAVARATGQIVPAAQIRAFVEKLDAHAFLDSPHYLERRRARVLEYTRWAQRPAQFAGRAYPAEPEPLVAMLDAAYPAPGAPGRPAAPVAQLPAGIAAPHIDPARGAAVYAHAYSALWGARPERVVLLGVSHAGGAQPFILTAKPYATPLGLWRPDAHLLEQLAARLDWDPFQEEELHRPEHSIEFQLLFLQHALAGGEIASLASLPEIVPILCTFDPGALPEAHENPSRARIEGFLDTLRTLLEDQPGPTLIVAGVDLAHVGPRFGDAEPVDQAAAELIRSRDLATLTLLARGDREAFRQETRREGNARRICGFPALYSLLALLPDRSGAVRHYDQSRDAEGSGLVSFAALVLE